MDRERALDQKIQKLILNFPIFYINRFLTAVSGVGSSPTRGTLFCETSQVMFAGVVNIGYHNMNFGCLNMNLVHNDVWSLLNSILCLQ